MHHFADTQQPWQKHSDGQMGRKIPGLLSKSVFNNNSQCITWRLVDTEFKPWTYGFLMTNMIIEVGMSKFTENQMQSWLQGLIKLNASGEYSFAIDLAVCICVHTENQHLT